MLLLVDLDGVVYRGPDPVPGVAAALATRAARGDDVVYVTNSSVWHHADFVARLTRMGAPVSPDRIVSGARATALYLSRRSPAPRHVLAVGAPGLVRELRDVGLEVTLAADAAQRWATHRRDSTPLPAGAISDGIDAVVVGLDVNFSYAHMAVAGDAVRRGAHFVAVNRDPIHPTERGLAPGAGSLVAAIATAAQVEPVTIGKPGPMLLEVAAQAVGRSVKDAIMIGDSLTADIPAAIAAGARSILMLTGVARAAHLTDIPLESRPTAIAADADELLAVLDGMSEIA